MKISTRLGCAFAAVSALVGCATEKPANPPASTSSHEQPSKAAAPTSQEGVRLYVFECGDIEILDLSLFNPNLTKGRKMRFTDSCYLVVHPKGTLAWDAGLSDELAKTPDGLQVMKGSIVLRVKKTLASQYKELGVAPDTVNYVGISHMHVDHRGNVGLFPRSTLLMQKEEYEAALGPDPAKYGLDPAEYPTLKANPVKKLEGDHDVFGDGTVVVKRALGHTPGHQALYIKLPKTGNILLSGDLVHFTENWKLRGIPIFNFDKERTVKTMQDVEQFLAANKATLWIQHDAEQNTSIRHAPAFYE